jgi:hypothetical protein
LKDGQNLAYGDHQTAPSQIGAGFSAGSLPLWRSLVQRHADSKPPSQAMSARDSSLHFGAAFSAGF